MYIIRHSQPELTANNVCQITIGRSAFNQTLKLLVCRVNAMGSEQLANAIRLVDSAYARRVSLVIDAILVLLAIRVKIVRNVVVIYEERCRVGNANRFASVNCMWKVHIAIAAYLDTLVYVLTIRKVALSVIVLV